MFGKVIVFELFEIIQKKKRVRIASPGSSSAFGSGRVQRHEPSQELSPSKYPIVGFSSISKIHIHI